MKIKKISINSVQEHPENPHKAPLGPIIESINENGVYAPIVVSTKTGNILKGNHTYKAQVQLGAEEVSAVLLDDLTPEQEIKILVGDNKIAQLGYDNDKKLKELLMSLETLEGTGFKEKPVLGEALNPEGDLEEAADLDEESNYLDLAKPKTIYKIGKHKLYTGSCLDETFFKIFEGSEKAGMVLTDPPYNVGYTGVDSSNQNSGIKNDKMSEEVYSVFAKDYCVAHARHLQAGGAIYMFFDYTAETQVSQGLKAAGLNINNKLIWLKNQMTSAVQIYGKIFEELFFAYKPGSKIKFYGFNNETTNLSEYNIHNLSKEELIRFIENSYGLIHTSKKETDRWHPTQKPYKLLERLILNSSLKGEIVLDGFAGSGSTLLAAAKLGRIGYGSEIDPQFYNLVLLKLQEITGQKPVDVETGEELDYGV